MDPSSSDLYRIVLGRAIPTLQPNIANGLAKLFSIPPSLAQQITRAAPIVILADLKRYQAMEIANALHPVRKAGADLRIEASDDRSISQVAWPAAPKINGKDLDEYATSDGEGSLIFCCPDCGGKFKIEITKLIAETEKKVVLPLATAPAPVAPPPAPVPPSVQQDKTPPRIDRVEDEDPLFSEMKPLLDTGPVSVLGDLREFETGLMAAADKPVDLPPDDEEDTAQTAVAKSVSKDKQPAPAKVAAASSGNFSVVLPKTNNPKAVAILMEVLNINDGQARDLMRKPLFAVAKGVSHERAQEIGLKFKRAGITVRLGRGK